MNNICFITVRSSSSRLKNKCFLDFGGIMVLEHIILRCFYGGLKPIVCTSDNKADKKIIKLARLMNVEYLVGSENNKILRWYSCVKKFKVKYFHTLDADDLFFDWDSIKKSLEILKDTKKDVILPSKISREGGASEGYSFSKTGIIKMINKHKILRLKNADIEMIDNYLKKLDKKKLNGSKYQKENIRLTLDYREDYIFLEKIRKNLGNFSHRKIINKFLNKNPKLSKINFFRNNDWRYRQKSMIKKNIRNEKMKCQ